MISGSTANKELGVGLVSGRAPLGIYIVAAWLLLVSAAVVFDYKRGYEPSAHLALVTASLATGLLFCGEWGRP